MEEFVQRIKVDMGRFSERVKEAERNRGLDLKALSHALRSLMQMEELLTTGKIRFPLRGREELIGVKEGKIDRDRVESRILKYLDAVNTLRETAPFHGTPDKDFARLCLLYCYGLNPIFARSRVF